MGLILQNLFTVSPKSQPEGPGLAKQASSYSDVYSHKASVRSLAVASGTLEKSDANTEVYEARYQKNKAHLSLFFFEDMFVSFLPQGILLLLFLAGICHCLGLCLAGSGCDCLGVLTLELLWHSNSCSSATNHSDC